MPYPVKKYEKPFQKMMEVSALVVDIRNFTTNLRNSLDRSHQHIMFDQFLVDFYDCCIEACRAACLEESASQVYMNSTGDGMLAVFFSENRHFVEAYIAGIIMTYKLVHTCRRYNEYKTVQIPDVSFGIGLESGMAYRITSTVQKNGHGPAIETYVGDCINIASRVEAVTKDHARTLMLLSQDINRLLCLYAFDEDYDILMETSINPETSEKERKSAWSKMAELNEGLLLTFIGSHNLRGVPEPKALFRLSPTLASPARRDFHLLLNRFKVGKDQIERIYRFIEYEKVQ